MKGTNVKHVAKMRKKSKPVMDLPFYLIKQSLFDPDNSLTIGTGNIIQTDCSNWVARWGSTLKPVHGLPEGHLEKYGVFVISNTVEDSKKKGDGNSPGSDKGRKRLVVNQ